MTELLVDSWTYVMTVATQPRRMSHPGPSMRITALKVPGLELGPDKNNDVSMVGSGNSRFGT